MNLEIISKAFLQMPLKKFACLVKFLIRNLHTFFLVVTKFSLVSSNFTLRKIKSFLDMWVHFRAVIFEWHQILFYPLTYFLRFSHIYVSRLADVFEFHFPIHSNKLPLPGISFSISLCAEPSKSIKFIPTYSCDVAYLHIIFQDNFEFIQRNAILFHVVLHFRLNYSWSTLPKHPTFSHMSLTTFTHICGSTHRFTRTF